MVLEKFSSLVKRFLQLTVAISSKLYVRNNSHNTKEQLNELLSFNPLKESEKMRLNFNSFRR